MALTHAGLSIPGTHETFQWGRWDRARQTNAVFGLEGITVLDGRRQSRPFTVPILIYNGYEQVELLTALGNLEKHTGKIGSLIENEAIERTMQNIEFDGLQLIGDMLPSNDIGWFVQAQLHFIQLSP